MPPTGPTGVDDRSGGVELWRAEGRSAGERARNWSEQLERAMLALDVASLDPAQYEAELSRVALGAMGLSLVNATGQLVRRTPEAVRRSPEQTLFLVQLRAGGMQFSQSGRDAVLGPGDCVVMDRAAPYHFTCPERSSALVAHLPLAWLRRWILAPEAVAGRVLDRRGGWGGVLSGALNLLDPRSVAALPVPGQMVAENLAALLALSAEAPPAATTPHQRRFLQRALGLMRDRLGEEDLAPTAVAQALGCSRGYLHRLFAQAGTTFAAELGKLRLDLASRLLADPRHRRTPVADIAAQCGFADPSHFARRFRRHAWQSPTAFRRR